MRWEHAMNPHDHAPSAATATDGGAVSAPDSPPEPPGDADPRVAVELTVIVPTRNEAACVPELISRLGPAVAAVGAEVLFVDDSDDDTPAEITRQAASCPVPVRVL